MLAGTIERRLMILDTRVDPLARVRIDNTGGIARHTNKKGAAPKKEDSKRSRVTTAVVACVLALAAAKTDEL